MNDLRKAAEAALVGLKQSIGLHIRNDEELEPIIEDLEAALAQPTKSWVGLDDNDFQYQTPQYVLTMKYAEAILRDKNK